MTDDPTAPRSAKQPLLPRWVKVLLVLVCVLLGAAALLWIGADVVTSQAVEDLLAEMKSEGWPMSFEELAPEPVPDEENAALLYMQADAAIPDGRYGHLWDEVWEHCEGLSAPRWEALPADLQEQLREVVRVNEVVLELLSRAARMPKCRLPIEYSDPYPRYAEGSPRAYRLCPLLRTAGFVALGDGHTEEAFQWWLALVAMSRHFEGHGLQVTEGSKLGCLGYSRGLLQVLIQSGQLTAAQVEEGLEVLSHEGGHEALLAGLRSRWLSRRILFEPLDDAFYAEWGIERPTGPEQWVYESWLGRPWRQYELAYCIAEVRRDVAVAETRPFDPFPGYDNPFPMLPLPAGLRGDRGIMFELSPGFATLIVVAEARAGLARAALALEGYRLTHGEYPRELADVVPEFLTAVPVDPFDGQPLRYVNEGNRLVVYSVGADLRDDGGSEEDDIVFTLRPGLERAEGPTDAE